VFIDQVGFELQGIFQDDPTTRSTPAFLFCPPLLIIYVNGVPCVQYPLPDSLFYWALDRQGKHRIAEDDWKNFNIPKLELTAWIGTYWESDDYNDVRDVLNSRNYNLDGRQYAIDHGHPELLRGE